MPFYTVVYMKGRCILMRMKMCLVLLLITCLLGGALAEDILPEHIRLAEGVTLPEVPQVWVYTVQMKDMRSFFDAQPLPEELIASVEENGDVREDGSRWEEPRYTLIDGTMLDVNEFGLTWMGDYHKYSQLLTYVDSQGIVLDGQDLAFMSAEEAAEACAQALADMGCERLTVAEVRSLSQERIKRLTQDMVSAWGDMKLDYFSEASQEDELYQVVFRSELDGLKTLGEPEAEFYMRADRVVYANIGFVIERVELTEEAQARVSAEEALRLFAESRGAMKSDRDEYEIISVSAGYAMDEPVRGHQAVYRPYWQIAYRATMHFGEQENVLPGTVWIDMIDGSAREIR